MKRAVIIGSGFGGLSAAAFLAQDGYEVTVLEMHEQPGGRARQWKKDGFTFDMGPSWYLMPDAFENFFAAFGKKPSDYYELARLDPSYRIYFGKNDTVDLSADLGKNIALFEQIEPGAGEKLRAYLAQAAYQYRVSMDEFLYRNIARLRDFFTKRMMTEGRKMRVFESLDRLTRRYFASERLRKILEYSMVFLGGAPKNTPALYSVINHADFALGVWYPQGGFGSVARGIERLGKEHGVTFRYNTEVKGIEVANGKAVGVRTADGLVEADIVVANADYHHVEMDMLPASARSYSAGYWRRRTVAPSAFIMYIGLSKKLSQAAHHMLMLDHDWVEHFNAIFDAPNWPKEPSYYVCCPSKTDPSVAPAEGENLFVLVPIASGLPDTEDIREAFGARILEHMEGILGTSIRDSILVKRTYSLNDFAADYHAFKGTALGLSHTLRQTALFRPKIKSPKVSNLYYVGQYTQPGIGVPMTLISGQLVRDEVRKDTATSAEGSTHTGAHHDAGTQSLHA